MMKNPPIDLESEVAQVRGELIAFQDLRLPAFFGRGGIPDVASPGPGAVALTSHEWELASDGLLDALPLGGRVGRLDLHEEAIS
jgi:hypothetical protein